MACEYGFLTNGKATRVNRKHQSLIASKIVAEVGTEPHATPVCADQIGQISQSFQQQKRVPEHKIPNIQNVFGKTPKSKCVRLIGDHQLRWGAHAYATYNHAKYRGGHCENIVSVAKIQRVA